MKTVRCYLLLVASVLSAAAARHTDLEYGRAGGESLKLDAYVPDGPGPFAAVILVHGTGDVTVPYAQSTAFQARLRAAGVTCDLQTIPDGAHGMLNWTKLAPDYAAPIVAWLQRTLGGARSAQP